MGRLCDWPMPRCDIRPPALAQSAYSPASLMTFAQRAFSVSRNLRCPAGSSLSSVTTALGPVQLMSDVLQRCEILMLDGKVQFALARSHPNARGVLDADDFKSEQIGSDKLIAVCQPDETGKPRHPLVEKAQRTVPTLEYTSESGLGRILRAVLGRQLESAAVQVVFTAHLASVLRTMALAGKGVAWLP